MPPPPPSSTLFPYTTLFRSDFIRPEVDELRPRISVIGVGGAGGNAIANMIASEVQGVDFIVANTDAQALNASPADRRIQRSEEHTSELQSHVNLVCRLLLEK